eukprot:TRINITY_DN2639_c0_g1_i1.p1 TRINITY_DN2639_c0_g1~~TRINITY_DN2639_c0_g1_i1.p1  ORF type:complete len:528 (+),score=104.89 TRINITY_DN2639_c0_g1_i1:306-1889(+)
MLLSSSTCLPYREHFTLSLCQSVRQPPARATKWRLLANAEEMELKNRNTDINSVSVCTADELHYVDVPGTDWELSLWRYNPSSRRRKRNHPLLLLSGLGTNAIGYDLAPEASFARYMSDQGFDTWILEVRGAGLSKRKGEATSTDAVRESAISKKFMDESIDSGILNPASDKSSLEIDIHPEDKTSEVVDMVNAGMEKSEWEARLSEMFLQVSEKLSYLWKEGQDSVLASGIARLSKTQHTVPQISDLQERLQSAKDNIFKHLELIQQSEQYNWDFDNYLQEDLPAAMNYIQTQSAPEDGKLLAIGHSMGGILLYAHLSSCMLEEKPSGLAAIVALASSLDYTSSKSSLQPLVVLADTAQAFKVPTLPLGALMAAAYPLASQPPYALAWLTPQVSAKDMMHPELFKKLVLNNFCTVPAKVILQLSTAFRQGGLRNRAGTIHYKDYLGRCQTPVLAIAGDEDLICPPEAVQTTANLFPERIVTYRIFGGLDGIHYGHYDLVGGRLAAQEVYPCIIGFLTQHDRVNCSE